MPRRTAIVTTQEKALEPITPNQQRFIESLLIGNTISAAALSASISRRTATYWLNDPDHPVYIEYEKQRIEQQKHFHARVANLHTLALVALEESLSPQAPPAIRLKAALVIYEAHLQHVCDARPASSPLDLVEKETNETQGRGLFTALNAPKLCDIK